MKKTLLIGTICCILPIAVIGVFLLLGSQRGTSPVEPTAVNVGRPAPDFSLKDIDGQQFSLAAHKGKPVIIFAMFGGCGECIPVGQTLAQIQKDYAAQGVSVVAVDILNGEPVSTLQQYRDFAKANFPLISYDAAVVQAYQLSAPEITYVIDRNGNIVFINRNALNYDQYKEQLEKIL